MPIFYPMPGELSRGCLRPGLADLRQADLRRLAPDRPGHQRQGRQVTADNPSGETSQAGLVERLRRGGGFSDNRVCGSSAWLQAPPFNLPPRLKLKNSEQHALP